MNSGKRGVGMQNAKPADRTNAVNETKIGKEKEKTEKVISIDAGKRGNELISSTEKTTKTTKTTKKKTVSTGEKDSVEKSGSKKAATSTRVSNSSSLKKGKVADPLAGAGVKKTKAATESKQNVDIKTRSGNATKRLKSETSIKPVKPRKIKAVKNETASETKQPQTLGLSNEQVDIARRVLEISDTVKEAVQHMRLKLNEVEQTSAAIMLQTIGEGLTSQGKALTLLNEKIPMSENDELEINAQMNEIAEALNVMINHYFDEQLEELRKKGKSFEKQYLRYDKHLNHCLKGISVS